MQEPPIPYHTYTHHKWKQDVLGMRPGSIATSVNADVTMCNGEDNMYDS